MQTLRQPQVIRVQRRQLPPSRKQLYRPMVRALLHRLNNPRRMGVQTRRNLVRYKLLVFLNLRPRPMPRSRRSRSLPISLNQKWRLAWYEDGARDLRCVTVQ